MAKKSAKKKVEKITDEHPGLIPFNWHTLKSGRKVGVGCARGNVYVRFHDENDKLGVHFRASPQGAMALYSLLGQLTLDDMVLGMGAITFKAEQKGLTQAAPHRTVLKKPKKK